MNDKHVCSICGKEFNGFGNNAEPVNDGLCCDKCNDDIVIPRRLADFDKKKSLDANEKVKNFLNGYYKAKFDMLLKWKIHEVVCQGKASKKFIDKLFEETADKMCNDAKSKLDDEVVNCILADYIDVVKEDIDVVLTLYELVHGKKFMLSYADLDMLFK
jgi:hypothetical protein|nr:MAG TPA: zinc-ribbon domain protein [Caudoviricetes sp.]